MRSFAIKVIKGLLLSDVRRSSLTGPACWYASICDSDEYFRTRTLPSGKECYNTEDINMKDKVYF